MAKMFGADNPAYRGGVTKLRMLIRNSKMYKQWKELVYQRDRYKCQKCGLFGDNSTLECHHIHREFADILQDFIQKYSQYSLPKDEQRLLLLASVYTPFWDVKNGETLCKDCHRQHHKEEKEAKKNEKLSQNTVH